MPTYILSNTLPWTNILFLFGRNAFLNKYSQNKDNVHVQAQSIINLSSRKHTYIILTPFKPHFYIVKLGFTGVYIIFLISAQKHRLWVLVRTASTLEPPRRGGSNEYPQSMFWAEMWKKYQNYYLKTFCFWWWNFQYIWIGVFSQCSTLKTKTDSFANSVVPDETV